MIHYVEDEQEKRTITKQVLLSLVDWFGIESSRDEYVEQVAKYPFITYEDDHSSTLGFFSLKPTSSHVLEIYVCGIHSSAHRKGIGTLLFQEAIRYAQIHGYHYLQVKTVAKGHNVFYDQTNAFYQAKGFVPFEIIPTLWNESNPCQIYIYAIQDTI